MGAARIIRGLLFGLEPHDPSTVSIVVALLIAVAVTAAYLPARQASPFDPLVTLRYE